MRFTSVLFAGLVAVASAQDATTTEEATSSVAPVADPPTTTVPLTPEQSRVAACLEACGDGDVSCEAKCVNVPNPNEDMVSANQACVEACPRGNGTEADIMAYESCLVGCVGTHYHPSTTGGSTSPTGGSSGNGDGSSSDGDSDSNGNGDGDSTSEGAEGSDSNDGDDDDDGNGAAALSISTTAFGLAAFIAAFAAL